MPPASSQGQKRAIGKENLGVFLIMTTFHMYIVTILTVYCH